MLPGQPRQSILKNLQGLRAQFLRFDDLHFVDIAQHLTDEFAVEGGGEADLQPSVLKLHYGLLLMKDDGIDITGHVGGEAQADLLDRVVMIGDENAKCLFD